MAGGSSRPWDCMGVMAFPIPYEKGCSIVVHNPSRGAAPFFGEIFYVDGFTLPYRLRGRSATWLNRITGIARQTEVEFLNTEGNGWLVWHSMAMDGVESDTYLEADIDVYIDGEASPSIKSTGTEDWFLSGWYFAAKQFSSSPFAFCSMRDTKRKRTMAAVDLLAALGGIRFEESVKVGWDYTEGAIRTECDMCYLILWYERV